MHVMFLKNIDIIKADKLFIIIIQLIILMSINRKNIKLYLKYISNKQKCLF